MALTLVQAKALSQDKLVNQVIDEFVESPLMAALPFDNTVKPQGGNTLAYVYNRVTTLPSAATRAINSEYVPQETVTTQQVVNLKVMGGSFQIDRVLANNEVQVIAHVAFQTQQKGKATKAVFHDLLINGDSGADATQFDGLDKAVTGSSTEITPAAAIALDSAANIGTNHAAFLYQLRMLIGKMDGVTHLLMNSQMYAVFQSLADRVANVRYERNALGQDVLMYGEAALVKLGDKAGTSNPIIPIDGATGETAIYAIRVGLDGVHGVSPDGNTLVNVFLPDMTAPGAVKTGEVEFVAAIALKATKAAGVLRKIKVQ